jgi:hypothetical protein
MTDQQIEQLEELLFESMIDPIGVDEIQAVFAAIASGDVMQSQKRMLMR